ncbi:probable disease resistance protein At4g27220 isoform X2 [Citrus sinensis]|uniref:probable disease resistance protein At4g27220 isoform X2 n=1 Tax=Citrus sinensis TaxID=2711 RepID=UPI0022793EAE|nr:probable disease resistance protein At4g27220 isoform X2 [Citrus sinensis]
MPHFIFSATAKVLGQLVGAIPRQLRNYKSNFDDLKKKTEKLKLTLEDLHLWVDAAKENGEEIEQSVEKWLISANTTVVEAGKLIEDEEKEKKKCLKGLCPNLMNRYQLSKKAAWEVKAIAGLLEEGKFDEVSFCTKPEGILLMCSEGYEAFESRKSILNDALDALSNPNVNVIGLCGLGGIGKTTLAKIVFYQAKKLKLCDEVVFVEVSQTPDVKRIQGDIADQLGLYICEGSESERAMVLCGLLKKGKKILVLDNIWTSLDLDKVGIPLRVDHKGCKIVLTSRSQDVLANEMHCQNNYCVSILNKEEAWSLFTKRVGDCVEDCEMQSIGIQIAEECGGLPLAIVTVARALRNKSLAEWKDALQELRYSVRSFKGLDAVVHSSIELSYNYLIDQEAMSTFLLCGLLKHPYDAHVMDLLKYGTGLRIFKGTYTMQERRDRLYALVHKLKDYCLLLDGPTEDWIRMHDLVREVAISIASRDRHVFMLRNDIQIEWPVADMLKNCPTIFLHDCKHWEVPEGLEYPQLEFFCMSPRDHSIKIPNHVFAGMSNLRGLALSNMQFLSLPSLFHLPLNLQTLCLDRCALGDIAIIGNLKKLEILSLVDSNIEQLPEEMAQLTQLRLFDLSGCSKLKVIPPNLLSGLSRLEDLYMGNTSVKWEFEGLNVGRSNASLQELKLLSHLTTLEIQICDAMILPKGLFSKKLERYKIFIGDEWDWSGNYKNKRVLKLKLYTSNVDEVIMQLKGIEELYLDEVPGIKNVLYDLDIEGFLQLKHLHVQNNPFILFIVDSMAWVRYNAFLLLESLVLHNLIHLEKICLGQLRAESFYKLKIIKVRNCDKLKNIFSFSFVRGLPQLQTLNVINCKNMKEIFTVGRENDVDCHEVDKIEFSQLHSLTLKFLPQLTSFYSQVKTSAASQTRLKELSTHTLPREVILEDECDTLMPFFNEKVVFPNLETLELCAISTEKIWCNQLAAVYSQNLTRLIVHGCEKLKYLFPSSMIRNFVQLEHLEICYCSSLESIVGKESGEEATTTFVFPKVTFLKLWNLSELKTFYPGTHTSKWPMLKKLEVYGCDKVKIFTSRFLRFQEINEGQFDIPAEQALFLVEKVTSKLEELKLSGKDIAMICQSQFPKHIFRNLKNLEVVNDESENFRIGFLERFHNLEKLELRWSSYKEIFSNEDIAEHAEMITQVKSLKLWELSDLMYIWKQDSKLDSITENLESLEVWWCENLINLVPSSASFKNLTTLELWYCQRLMNLVTSSTAKSLVCLTKLRIDGCRMLTEIISKEEDVAEDEIVFSKLKWVSLERLENLTSFCSGNYTLKFPSLEDLFVIECPKMKIFSHRVLSTPRLREVRQNWGLYKGCWEGDLNTTIQQLQKNELPLLLPIASSSSSLAAPTTGNQVPLNLSGNRKTQSFSLQPPLRTTSPTFSSGKPAADNNPSLSLSSCSTRTKKAVLKLEIHGEKARQKAFSIVSKFTGVLSILFDPKDKKMIVIGDIDAVPVVRKLRKQLCATELVSIGPANEHDNEEGERNIEESKNNADETQKQV